MAPKPLMIGEMTIYAITGSSGQLNSRLTDTGVCCDIRELGSVEDLGHAVS